MQSKTILICSNNKHKQQEYSAIGYLYDFGISFVTLADVSQQFSCPETGSSFLENAFQKAHAYQNQTTAIYPFLVEDSGICVDALQGAPGVISARYGQSQGKSTDEERAYFLLEMLTKQQQSRSAHYTCTTIFFLSRLQYIVVEEIWSGSIAESYSKGETGFGYDPIFIPDGCSQPVSMLSDDEKHHHSHRSRALRRVVQAYKSISN